MTHPPKLQALVGRQSFHQGICNEALGPAVIHGGASPSPTKVEAIYLHRFKALMEQGHEQATDGQMSLPDFACELHLLSTVD
jgi:hypothetical protein